MEDSILRAETIIVGRATTLRGASFALLNALMSRFAAPLIIGLGFAFRFIWLWHQQETIFDYGETMNVAYAIFHSGQIADAFRPGQGPTAHLMPLSPIIAAGVFHLFGFRTALSDIILSLWSLVLIFASFWLQMRVFLMLGLNRIFALTALSALCLIPLNFSLEVMWFRVWEGGLAVALASLLLYLLVKWDGSQLTGSKTACVALVVSLLLFVEPPMGAAGILACGLFSIRSRDVKHWLGITAIAVSILGAIFLPWTIRNYVVMGAPIALRSNFGLELALAFRPGAVSTPDPRASFWEQFIAIHPNAPGPGYSAMQKAGGELHYYAKLKHTAVAWMKSNPREASILMGRHVVEMFFPPKWYWTRGEQTEFKLLCHWLLATIGIAGIACAMFAKDRRFAYPIIVTLVTVLPYAFVQPTLRYRYLVFGLLVYFGTYFVWRTALYLGSQITRFRQRTARFQCANLSSPKTDA